MLEGASDERALRDEAHAEEGGDRMSETNWRFATRRSRLAIALALGGVATVVMAWAVAAPSVSARDFGPGCADGNVCWWELSDYNGHKTVKDCQTNSWDGLDTAHSAKNRCGAQRAMALYWDNNNEWTACLDSGENRPDPGRFNFVFLGGGGSTCS
jgi:hypothetical protein